MSIAYHSMFGYLIPALVGIVGANIQDTTVRLLETHTTNIWSFLIVTIIYCYAHVAHQENSSQSRALAAAHRENSSQSWALAAARRENSSQSWALTAVVSGSVSAVSLISTFVPRSDVGHIVLYTAWICASIIIVVHQYGTLFTEACRQLYNETLKPFCTDICNRFQAVNTYSTGQRRPALPV